jgi:hypothetical protein
MKTLKLLSILVAFLIMHGCRTSNSEIPNPIKAKFAQLYPNINVEKWENEGKNYEAAYKEGSVSKTIVLDPQGQVLQTETNIDQSALPPVIASYIKTNYSTYKIHEAISIMSAAGVHTYEVGCKDGGNDVDLTFDNDGKFLSKEDDND